MSLTGKVALITGGAKNLGAAVALQLAPIGANLALHYHGDDSKKEADALEALLKESNPNVKVVFYQADLTSATAVEDLFKAVVKDFGGIDIVINTVGMVLKKSAVEISEQEYDQIFAVNSKAAFFILKNGALTLNNGGKMITIGTALLAAFTGNYTCYAGSKSPVEHFTRGLSKELSDRRISVNCVAPGPMDTPFFYPQETEGSIAYLKSGGMGGRLTEVGDIAPLIRFLVTEGGWVTGQTIFANGGFSTR